MEIMINFLVGMCSGTACFCIGWILRGANESLERVAFYRSILRKETILHERERALDAREKRFRDEVLTELAKQDAPYI